MIEAIDLTVRRRGRTVLDAVSFDVRPGQVTGVLGGTGAGKTVLLRRMVELERGRGETLFDGRPYHALHHPMREVGLLLDPAVGDPDRTVRGHLRLALATDRRAARESVMASAQRASGADSAVSRYVRGEGASPVIYDSDDGDAWHGDGSDTHSVEGAAPQICGAAESAQGVRGGASAATNSRSGAGTATNTRSGPSAPDKDLSDRLKASRRGRPADRIEAVLDIVGLSEQSRTRLADLTEGMATRLGIAVALLGDPKTLLLDCPDRALEPEGVAWLATLLRVFTAQGRAALVTGSDTETLVGMVDRVLLLDSGYLVGTRTSEEVLRAPTGASVVVRSPQIVRFAAILAEAGARSTQGDGACLEVRGLDRARVGDLAYRHSIPVHELSDRFTGSDPADLVLAACTGRRARPVVPIQGFPDGKRVVGVPVSVGTTISNPAASNPAASVPGATGVRGAGFRSGRTRTFRAKAVDGASGMEPTGSVRLITVLPEPAPGSQVVTQAAARTVAQATPQTVPQADASLAAASGNSLTEEAVEACAADANVASAASSSSSSSPVGPSVDAACEHSDSSSGSSGSPYEQPDSPREYSSSPRERQESVSVPGEPSRGEEVRP